MSIHEHPLVTAVRTRGGRAATPVDPRGIGRDRGLAVDPRRPAVFRARDLHKSYGSGRSRTPILRGVSLSVARGEMVFLVGPSGSGKTTLLSLLGCILSPDRGELEILGMDVSGMRAEERTAFRREHLGFVFQQFHLMPTLSALDNVQLALSLRGVPSGRARREAVELLERVGVAHRARLRPGRLSTGESQRVAVARALAGDPAILLADEPTASLDAENGRAILHMLTALARERGRTVVIVTHDDRIFPFADRILHLDDGRLADETTLRTPGPRRGASPRPPWAYWREPEESPSP